MAVIIVAIEGVEISMTAQALSGTKISIAGIQIGGDGTMGYSRDTVLFCWYLGCTPGSNPC